MKREIRNPHYINNARTVIAAQFVYDDGRVVDAVISESETGNPDLREIKRLFAPEVLEANTRENIKKVSASQEAQRIKEEAQAQRKQAEDLFAVKLKVFEIPLIKASTDRSLKARIRRSKTDVEAMAWASVLLAQEMVNDPAGGAEASE
ncbi:hypothetical protein EBT25_11790 [bacterium]|jgi:hypothetical protein|nr:hypothetical protein [bacterium]